MPDRFRAPDEVMRRAIDLARQGEGFVEPNPMVGAVVVDNDLQLLGEGYHRQFGGPHAEVHALEQAGERARGGTLFVTLEPCCHQGKTPPCTDAVIGAGVRKVVVGLRDPFPQVSGQGIERLRAAGIEVETGVLEDDVRRLNAPYVRKVTTGLPWVHAKWAMTLDGKIASRTGASKWISNEKSRAIVHRLRGRMDAIITGSGTVLADDPLLTARPPGPRTATRVVVDGQLWLPPASQLVRTAREVPVLLACGKSGSAEAKAALAAAGVEIQTIGPDPLIPIFGRLDLRELLRHLGESRRCTNVLLEAGGGLTASFFDEGLIDEVHVFIAPRLVGGKTAKSPIAGVGREQVAPLPDLVEHTVEVLDGDVYVHGAVRR
jgi:diaminohydroxyphosphoribosylaminopyrimidine deaminase / 5-amino-6-(5-phosphoribosylamino)uracil reductase